MHFNKTLFRLIGDVLVLKSDYHQRNLALETSKLWPNGNIYYNFKSDFQPLRKSFIVEKMNELESISNFSLSFIQHTNQNYWIEISEFQEGCYANIGRIPVNNQPQMINIGFGCLSNSIVKHELMHAIGFQHEQSRVDRNAFVDIIYQNIEDGFEDNFDIALGTETQGLNYDYNSILHYNKDAFSKNGQNTIESRTKTQVEPASEMTVNDINKIRLLYNQELLDISKSNRIKFNFSVLKECLLILLFSSRYI